VKPKKPKAVVFVLTAAILVLSHHCALAQSSGLIQVMVQRANPQTTPAPAIVSTGLLPNNQYDFVIITNYALSSYFQALANCKNSLGIKTIVWYVESIKQNYPGADLKTQIRNFIKDAYATWKIKYVLLGGDISIIPAFYMVGYDSALNPPVTWIPCDSYYSGLEGEWTFDGTRQQVDITPEVFVGRAPVETAIEANNFVNKNIHYLDNVTYRGNALMVAEYDPPDRLLYPYLDAIETRIKNNNNKYSTEKLYDLIANYKMYLWSANGLINGMTLINNQYIHGLNANRHHLIFHHGHSNPTRNLRLVPDDIKNITNYRPFIIYSTGCYGVSFDGWDRHPENMAKDGDCIAEKLVTSPFGAVAYIGNSREGNSMVINYAYRFAEKMNGIDYLGEVLARTRYELLKLYYYDSHWIWTGMGLNLLGDPTLDFQGKPLPLYRFYNPKSGAHFYTTSEAEKTKVITLYSNVFTYEGVSCNVKTRQEPGTIPMYRYFNPQTVVHIFTTKLQAPSPTYVYEGIAFYIFSEKQYNTVPLYKFYNKNNGAYFYTKSTAERDNLINNFSWVFTYQGIACYVF
jgi:hypothetical protein